MTWQLCSLVLWDLLCLSTLTLGCCSRGSAKMGVVQHHAVQNDITARVRLCYVGQQKH